MLTAVQTVVGTKSGSKVRIGSPMRFSRPLRSFCGPNSGRTPSSACVCRAGCAEPVSTYQRKGLSTGVEGTGRRQVLGPRGWRLEPGRGVVELSEPDGSSLGKLPRVAWTRLRPSHTSAPMASAASAGTSSEGSGSAEVTQSESSDVGAAPTQSRPSAADREFGQP